MNLPLKFPFYAKASLVFIGLLAFISTLYIARIIIVPLLYSIIIAITLSPIVHFFVKKKVNRIVAITLALLFLIVITSILVAFLLLEIGTFNESFPKLLEKFDELLNHFIEWTSSYFTISTYKINLWLAKTKSEILDNTGAAISYTLSTISSFLLIVFLIPVYVFALLFYQPLLLEFIHKLFGFNYEHEVSEILVASKKIIQNYLVGLVLKSGVVALLYAVALFLLGIDYAILLSVLGAMLNVIPYIGGIIAVMLPMMIALLTKPSPSYTLYVLLFYVLIQFIDGHYLTPKIVASKVRINALISIIVVLAGGVLWGIPGMFLSIPLTAILKIIFDHIDNLKPWGYLLGDTMTY